jgi:hypothetical protein
MAERRENLFFVDTSSIPLLQNPDRLRELTDRVKALLGAYGMPEPDVENVPLAAVRLGMVVLDGEVDANSAGLPVALQRAWAESLQEMPAPRPDDPKARVPLATVYAYIADVLPAFKGGSPERFVQLSVQEFAFVSREVIAGGQSIPFGHPAFDSAIRIALDHYVESRSEGDSMDLPPDVLPGGAQNAGGDADLNVANVKCTGLCYALALLEQTQVFRVTDRLAERFMNGQMPFGQGAAGKALDNYYWSGEDRPSESQRRSTYSRMVGMPGGEVSKEVSPNKNFEQLYLRFISAVAEFTRQREVDRMFSTTTSRISMTGEQVRKAAFEVAQNASQAGWGGGFHITARINRHLKSAIEILNEPQVLRAYAAGNHWQVIERVGQQDFGGTPNWTKYSAMAQASSKVFDILSRNTAVLSLTNSGLPFLYEETFRVGSPPLPGPPGRTSDLSRQDTMDLLASVQLWLAVSGVRDDQVKQYSQPVEMNTVPSLPGMPGGGGDGAAGMEVLNKLKQLTASGTPTPDQLQQLLATLH